MEVVNIFVESLLGLTITSSSGIIQYINCFSMRSCVGPGFAREAPYGPKFLHFLCSFGLKLVIIIGWHLLFRD